MLSRRQASGRIGAWRPHRCMQQRRRRRQPMLTDDGLYHPAVVSRELAGTCRRPATRRRRRASGLAIMWELRGCPYCKRDASDQFRQAGDREFIKERFEILQLNIIGAREVTDFDGEKLSEKRLAREIRRPLHADFPVLPGQRRRARQQEAARARGRPRAGLSGAAAVPGDVPLRRRARLRASCATCRRTVIKCASVDRRMRSVIRPSDRRSPWSAARRPSRRPTART